MSDHPLVLRAAATQATLDQWTSETYRMGHADCVRMTASHLRRMGHTVRLPPKGSYRTPRGAEKQLAERGCISLSDAMDQMGFERIPPAAALAGDVVGLPSDPPTDALDVTLCVALGNGRVLGWHDDAPGGARVLQPLEFVAAWRIDPKD